MKEDLIKMKTSLMSIVESQIYGNLEKVDAKELGEAIDMIKDLSEAEYYCTITEAMKKKEYEENEDMMYYSGPTMYNQYPIEYYDPRYRETYNYDTMYAQNGGSSGQRGSSNGGGGGRNNYTMYTDGRMRHMTYRDEPIHPYERSGVYQDGVMKDPKEGKSGMHRKMYMEGKGMKDKSKQMQELEAYMQELTSDMSEMIMDASPEEKQLLQQKINMLAQKIK